MEKELNKAAEQYASDYAPDYPDIGWETCYEKMEESFKAGAQWLGKLMIAKLKFASDTNASIVGREPKNEVALFLMQFSEAQIQQVLNLMRVDKTLYRDDILKEIGYVSPNK